jgi:serine/threonine protein kinase
MWPDTTDYAFCACGPKVMRKKDLIRKNLVENACFEKEIMCSANNPFIVRSYYSFTSRDNLYIVMEYISGGDAASLLRSIGALDEDIARQYIAETILALEWCHGQVGAAPYLLCEAPITLHALDWGCKNIARRIRLALRPHARRRASSTAM